VRSLALVVLLVAPAIAQPELTPPSLPSPTKPALGAAVRFALPSGLKAVVASRKGSGVIDVVLAVRAGEQAAPAGKPGVAAFVAEMLRKGTKTQSAAQLSEAAANLGAVVDSSAGDEATYIRCRARARELARCMDLVAELAQRPTFPDGEIAEVRNFLSASADAVRQDAHVLAELHARNLYFGDADPRGRTPSPRVFGTIDRAELLKFHQTWFAPNNAVIVIAGDGSENALRAQVSRAFGGWKAHALPPVPPRPLPAAGPLRVRVVDLPTATQSTLALIGPGVVRAAPDYFAAELMAHALGGRGEAGKLRSIGFVAGAQPAVFLAEISARTAETGASLATLLRELDKMREGGPTADELTAAKTQLIGAFGLRHESGEDVARALVDAELDGLDGAFVAETPRRLDTVTPDQARAAATAHLAPAALVVVGRAEDVKAQLGRLRVAESIEVVPYNEPIGSADRAAARIDKIGPTSAEQAAAGAKLLADAVAAKGRITPGMTCRGRGTLGAMGQKVAIRFSGFYVFGKAAREDVQIGPRAVSQVVPPDGPPFKRQGSDAVNLPQAAAAAMRRAIARDPNYILANAARGTVRAEAPVREGGTTYDVLTVIVDGEPTTLWLDPKTHLPVRLLYTENGREIRDELSDYRPVGGVLVPFRIVGRRAGETLDLSYDSVELTQPSLDLFKR
jgi:predicted Zn-dependent peptidase